MLVKRVLVTGATGGVGRIAVQLARASGAHVTALVRSPATVRGADAVVQALDGDFDLIVDCVGRLDPQVELERPWTDFAAARDALLARRIGGKAVLRVQS